jgi:hypothetical protein
MKIPEFKRFRIGLIAEFCGILSRSLNQLIYRVADEQDPSLNPVCMI